MHIAAWKENPLVRKLLRRRTWRNVFSMVGPRYVEATVENFKMYLDLTDKVGVSRLILKNGRFEAFASQLVQSWIKPNMAVIDVGANIGYWSVLMAKLTSKTVYAFEPEPANFALLENNLTLNGIKNVKAFAKAAGAAPARLRLFKSAENFGDHRLYASDEKRDSVEVEVVALDSELGSLPDLGFVKIDVQGFELPVMKGMKNLLETAPDLAILSEFWPNGMKNAGQDPVEYLDFMEFMGFRYKLVDQKQHELRTVSRADLFKHCETHNEADLWWTRDRQ